tara:strand:+ start:7173 stop:8195 length:1023 start_codon:yes stop_codon:yes gene_type:complete
MSSPKFLVCSLNSELEKKYINFAEKNFKRSGYQFNTNYLKYLYDENPYTTGLSDCRIILKKVGDKSEIVGCIHNINSKLYFSNQSNMSIRFSGIHNLMIDKDNLGIGYKLMNDIIKQHQNFYVPGVVGNLNKFYSKIGAKQILNQWFRKFIFPNIYQSILRIRGLRISESSLKRFSKNILQIHGVKLHHCRSNQLAEIISKDIDSADEPKLSTEYIFWRIFGDCNPDKQTFVMTLDNDYAIFSVGCRKNIPVLRLVYVNSQILNNAKYLMGYIMAFARSFGMIGIFSASDNSEINYQLKLLKFNEIKNAPKSYLYSKHLNDSYSSYWPLMGDYGFDEFYK